MSEDFTPNRDIKAVRFVENRVYISTSDSFLQVIDLRNSAFPSFLGQIKLDGFSSYFHPYDENILIGIGRQTESNGNPLGLKIAIFDVSNVANLRQVDSFALEEKYASSLAELEHKAFLFSREKNLLVIPGSLDSPEARFNGAFIFRIDPYSIALTGIIDHLQSPTEQFDLRNV